MNNLCHAGPMQANPGLSKSPVGGAQESGHSIPWRKIFQAFWQVKPAAEFAARTNTSMRHAERVMSGERGVALDTFFDLIDEADGGALLIEALESRGCKQPWFKDMKIGIERGDIKRRQRALRARLERLEAADE
jgi:hypothetical protein